MTGHDDPAPVRREPHLPNQRLLILRIYRPPVNAPDQVMCWGGRELAVPADFLLAGASPCRPPGGADLHNILNGQL